MDLRFDTSLINGYKNAAQIARILTLLERRFLGIDKEEEFLNISRNRKHEIEDLRTFASYRKKVKDIALLDKENASFLLKEEEDGYDLPF